MRYRWSFLFTRSTWRSLPSCSFHFRWDAAPDLSMWIVSTSCAEILSVIFRKSLSSKKCFITFPHKTRPLNGELSKRPKSGSIFSRGRTLLTTVFASLFLSFCWVLSNKRLKQMIKIKLECNVILSSLIFSIEKYLKVGSQSLT